MLLQRYLIFETIKGGQEKLFYDRREACVTHDQFTFIGDATSAAAAAADILEDAREVFVGWRVGCGTSVGGTFENRRLKSFLPHLLGLSQLVDPRHLQVNKM